MIPSQRINARKVVLWYIYWFFFVQEYNNKKAEKLKNWKAEKEIKEIDADDALFLQELWIQEEDKEEEQEEEERSVFDNRWTLEDDTAFIAKSIWIHAEDIDWEYVFLVAEAAEWYMPKMADLINTYATEFSYEDMEMLKKAIFVLGYTEHKALGTDTKVIINETIELAKRFWWADTFKLINSIFHKLIM